MKIKPDTHSHKEWLLLKGPSHAYRPLLVLPLQSLQSRAQDMQMQLLGPLSGYKSIKLSCEYPEKGLN